jgi:cytochrome oxidase Cu insertion factor (SCO1/SenC/PrrC family)
MSRTLIFWLAVLLMFAGGSSIWLGAKRVHNVGGSRRRETSQHAAHTATPLADFTFTDQLGRPFRSGTLDGKVWVGSFFFSRCPQICRVQNQQIAKLQEQFADKGLELVSITCEPDYDSPHRLAAYARLFNAQPDHWHFLTGDLDYTKQVAQDIFQVAVQEETHSDRVIVFDSEGTRRGYFRPTET